MKTIVKILIGAVMVFVFKSTTVLGQKIDEQRMERDIQVAENVLSTLLRQQFSKQPTFFPLDVKGEYQEGYGVTFHLPGDFTMPMIFTFNDMDHNLSWGEIPEVEEPIEPVEPPEPMEAPDLVERHESVESDDRSAPKVYSYSYKVEHRDNNDRDDRDEKAHKQKEKHAKDQKRVVIERNGRTETINISAKPGKRMKFKERNGANLDSMRDVYNQKMIEAAKIFLMDYSDLIGQLAPTEKIVISNQGDQPRRWANKLMTVPKRSHLTIEAQKNDVSLYKQGKMSKDQLLAKITVVNTESITSVEPDLELISSIFNRLYQPDLAKTYFIENELYYERLKDYGAIFYMRVYSSNQDDELFSMPTLKLNDLNQEARNKKVAELYPAFEKELKENILEYGRTVKSLKDNEILTFNVKLTKCKDCGIPSSVEVSVKAAVLKDFGLGKIDKNAAVTKFTVKKGPNQ